MSETGKNWKPPLTVTKYALILAVAWTLLVAAMVLWGVRQEMQDQRELIRGEANAHFLNNKAFRFWASKHWEDDVPPTEDMLPNPYLSTVPDRDVVTAEGTKVTLMNLAYVDRRLMEDYEELYGIMGRIVSLKPHNPRNAPDEWERAALKSFERGETEAVEFAEIDGVPYLRMMRPLITKKPCLECHGQLGYREGDVGGGEGVSVPVEPFYAQARMELAERSLILGLLWLLGLVALTFGARHIQRRVRERDRAEESLRSYECIVSCSHDMLALLDKNFVYLAVNERYAKAFGKTHSELVGVKASEVFGETLFEAVIRPNAEKCLQGYEVQYENWFDFQTSGKRYMEIIYIPYRGPDNEIKGFVVTSRDITERKQLEEELRESDEKLRAISSSANDAIVMIDNDGNITFWNDAAGAMFGASADEVYGRNFHEMFVPKKLHDQHQKAFNEFQNTGQGPVIGKTVELNARRKDGTEFPVELALSAVKYDENWHAIGMVRDVTERKKFDTELRKLSFAIEQSANAVVITDINGNIEYVNPKFTESTGYTADEAIGQTPRILKSGETSDESYEKLWETIAFGTTWSGEFHNKKKSGELFWEKETISPITDESGTIISYLAIKEDITEQKETEKKRQMLEMEMNQSRKLEAVGSLAAGIAHEINTPIQFVGDNTNFLSDAFESLLSLVEMYASLWQEANAGVDLASLDCRRIRAEENVDLEYLKGEIPPAIEQSLDGVQRVSKIVRAMKDFAHSDQGEKTVSDINDMLQSCLTVSRNELKYVADVETDLDPELPNIGCYRDDLNQVFLNLLINAAHTIADVVGDTSTGKGTITVSTLHDNDNVIIKIRDTGRGIPEEVRSRIFDPFFSTKDVGKGSGQGLSIARKIVVDKHEGSLDFETEEGKGSTFIIRLPKVSQEKTVEVS